MLVPHSVGAQRGGVVGVRAYLLGELDAARRRASGAAAPAAAPAAARKAKVLLVVDATTGGNALTQALQFHEAIGLTGLVVTKLDGTAKGGVLLAIAKRLALPIRFVGIGEGVDDLIPFDADAYADALVDR